MILPKALNQLGELLADSGALEAQSRSALRRRLEHTPAVRMLLDTALPTFGRKTADRESRRLQRWLPRSRRVPTTLAGSQPLFWRRHLGGRSPSSSKNLSLKPKGKEQKQRSAAYLRILSVREDLIYRGRSSD